MYKKNLANIVNQAYEELQGEILQMIRDLLERLLEEARSSIIGRSFYERRAGVKLYRWGYFWRQGFQTPFGEIPCFRLPRIRGAEGELCWWSKWQCRSSSLGEQLWPLAVGQCSYRKLLLWCAKWMGVRLSPSSMKRVIDEQVEQLRLRRKRQLNTAQIKALIIDGVHLTLRKRKKKPSSKAVLLLAVALYVDGSFEVVDWEPAYSESYQSYYRLLDRLYNRGLERVELIVGDGVPGLWAAVEVVYPFCKQQLCLYHLFQAMKRVLRDKRLLNQKRLGWQFWSCFDCESRHQAEQRLRQFIRTWKHREPEAVSVIEGSWPRLFNYFSLPLDYRHRARTTILAEGFFSRLRRFISRFPGLNDLYHMEKILATFLLSIEWYKKAKKEIPVAL